MSQQAFSFSGDAAKSYDQYLGPFLFEPTAVLLAALVEAPFSGKVLEIAAGSGRLTRHLVRRLEDPSLLTVTDLNTDMLAIAQQKVDQEGVVFQQEDMQALSFPDQQFDLLVCQYGVMFPPDKPQAFREMYRVLKPGGELLFTTWESTTAMPFFRLLFDETLLPFFREPDKTKYVVPFHMHHPDQLRQLMEQAGFRNITVEPRDFKGTAPSPAELVRGFIHHHQLSKEIREQEPEAVDRIATYLEEEIGKRFGPGPVNCDLRCYIGRAIR